MGTYNSVYVGVYIEATSYKVKIERKVFRKSSGKISKTKFNPHTGEECIEDTIIETNTITPHTYIEDNDELVEDMFFSPEYCDVNLFILNSSRNKYAFKNSSDLFSCEFSNVDISKLIEDFKVEYSEYIKYYKNKYSESDFKVKFGVVSYAN